MRTTLAIDDDILDEARKIAAQEGRSVGSVISSLARRALAPTQIRVDTAFPVFDVDADAPIMRATDVAKAEEDQ